MISYVSISIKMSPSCICDTNENLMCRPKDACVSHKTNHKVRVMVLYYNVPTFIVKIDYKEIPRPQNITT